MQVGVAKIRVQINSGLDKSDIRIKTLHPNPVQIINRTFLPDPDLDVRYSDPIVWMFEYVMWFFNIMIAI